MPSYINTNISSLNSQRNLNTSQSALATSLQRLSSGLRINSARDDAAGMAISSRMTSQINGNNQASRNANDGISLAQTAEGDLAQIGTNLQRMRDLAVQAANATNSASDRAALQAEVSSLAAEIERVAQNSSFNGVKLLDGSFVSQVFQVGAGATANDQIAIDKIASARTSELGAAGTTNYAANVAGTNTTAGLGAGDLTLNGIQVGASVVHTGAGQSTSSGYSIASAINTVAASTGVTATANATTAVAATTTAFTSIAANSFSINGVSVGSVAAGGTAAGQAANVAAAINAVSAQSGVVATVTGSSSTTTGQVTLAAVDGRNINVTANTNNIAGVITAYTSANLLAQTGFSALLSDTVVAAAAATASAATALTVNGVTITAASTASVLSTAENFVAAFNTAAGLSANATTLAGITASTNADGVVTLSSNGTQSFIKIASAGTGGAAGFVATQATTDGYISQHGSVSLSSTSSSGIVLSGGNAGKGGFTAATTAATITSSNMASISNVNVSTAKGATDALAAIDGAISAVNSSRATLGAYQNRFSSVVTSLQTTSENLTASRSRIMDTDFAAETSSLTRNQILQQAGTAMLAQANQLPQNVLTLLR